MPNPSAKEEFPIPKYNLKRSPPQPSVLNQEMGVLEATQTILRLFALIQSFDEEDLPQERIHTMLIQLCAGYIDGGITNLNITEPDTRIPPDSQAFDRNLNSLIDYCKDYHFDEKSAEKWLRARYGVRLGLTIVSLDELGILGEVLAKFYGQIFNLTTYSCKWKLDLHNNCLLVTTDVRRHLLTTNAIQWGLVSSDLVSCELIIGNSRKQNGTIFTVGIC